HCLTEKIPRIIN
uniref:Uncharacterized protein n=1 Tax=Solanum lycopersicum TaxID=4081 RepID=A0A3Q7I562_SOLLC